MGLYISDKTFERKCKGKHFKLPTSIAKEAQDFDEQDQKLLDKLGWLHFGHVVVPSGTRLKIIDHQMNQLKVKIDNTHIEMMMGMPYFNQLTKDKNSKDTIFHTDIEEA